MRLPTIFSLRRNAQKLSKLHPTTPTMAETADHSRARPGNGPDQPGTVSAVSLLVEPSNVVGNGPEEGTNKRRKTTATDRHPGTPSNKKAKPQSPATNPTPGPPVGRHDNRSVPLVLDSNNDSRKHPTIVTPSPKKKSKKAPPGRKKKPKSRSGPDRLPPQRPGKLIVRFSRKSRFGPFRYDTAMVDNKQQQDAERAHNLKKKPPFQIVTPTSVPVRSLTRRVADPIQCDVLQSHGELVPLQLTPLHAQSRSGPVLFSCPVPVPR